MPCSSPGSYHSLDHNNNNSLSVPWHDTQSAFGSQQTLYMIHALGAKTLAVSYIKMYGKMEGRSYIKDNLYGISWTGTTAWVFYKAKSIWNLIYLSINSAKFFTTMSRVYCIDEFNLYVTKKGGSHRGEWIQDSLRQHDQACPAMYNAGRIRGTCRLHLDLERSEAMNLAVQFSLSSLQIGTKHRD